MYMISRSLHFVSCTVHCVLLMLSTSSKVDYVPAVELTTYGLELIFFFLLIFSGGVCVCVCVRNRVQDKLFFRLCTCACVCCVLCACVYMVCVCRYIVWTVTYDVRVCCVAAASVYMVYVWGCVVWDKELTRKKFFLNYECFHQKCKL